MWAPVNELTLRLKRFVSMSVRNCFGYWSGSLSIWSIGVCVFGSMVRGCCLGSTFDTAPMEVPRQAVQVLP